MGVEGRGVEFGGRGGGACEAGRGDFDCWGLRGVGGGGGGAEVVVLAEGGAVGAFGVGCC